jgi:hypothetical protein
VICAGSDDFHLTRQQPSVSALMIIDGSPVTNAYALQHLLQSSAVNLLFGA